MKSLCCRQTVFLVAVFIIFACLLMPVAPFDLASGATATSPQNQCVAAVRRYQNAVTIEVYTFVNATKSSCDEVYLERRGQASEKTKAINQSAFNALARARIETAAAEEAAKGCDLSNVRKPRIVRKASFESAYSVCANQAIKDESYLRAPAVIAREIASSFSDPTCRTLLENLDCTELEVSEEDKQMLAEAVGAEPVAEKPEPIPANVRTECRQAYLDSRAALRQELVALERVGMLGRSADAATGAKGRILLETAQKNYVLDREKATAASETFKACQAGEVPAGSLSAKMWIKEPAHNACCGGTTDYTYDATSATMRYDYPPGDGGDLTLKWTFEGVPASLTPDKEITITISGTFTAELASRDMQPPASAGVRVFGLDVISQQNAYTSRLQKRDGKYVFKVPRNATGATIELGGDYGFGIFAIYRYGDAKK